MRGQFQFLTTGEAFEVLLPETYDPRPDAVAAVTLGTTSKDLIYEPRSRRTDPDQDPLFQPTARGEQNGVQVTIYEARQTPVYVAAFWRLASGYLFTFVDDMGNCGADLDATIRRIVTNLSVTESKFGPVVTAQSPVQLESSEDPFGRQFVSFFRPNLANESEAIRFERAPAWATEGRSVRRGEDGAEVAVTTDLQVTVRAQGPPDSIDRLSEYASDAAASLVPL